MVSRGLGRGDRRRAGRARESLEGLRRSLMSLI
jgi:hypothetical protein